MRFEIDYLIIVVLINADKQKIVGVYINILFFVCNYFQCVGEDIEDVEYTPKPEYEGYFKLKNVKNEV